MIYSAHPDDNLVERFVRPRPRTCWAIKIEERSIEAARTVSRRYGVSLRDPEFFYGQWMVIWPDKNVEFYSDKDLDATFETELR